MKWPFESFYFLYCQANDAQLSTMVAEQVHAKTVVQFSFHDGKLHVHSALTLKCI